MSAPSLSNFEELLRRFQHYGVAYIIVGGVAGTIHGSARLTYDLDIVYRRDGATLEALVQALNDVAPYLRGAPPGLPFDWSAKTLQAGLNFTLTTTLGDLDLLGEIAGGGTYEALLPHCFHTELFGIPCLCLDLETLIRTKRAAGRPKDLEAIAELEAIRDEQAD